VSGVHRACSDTKVQFILQSKVADDFSFTFVSPEGADDNRARHKGSPLKGLPRII
jgi:hypothetical protein